jgi:quinol monooxygenase YgiN
VTTHAAHTLRFIAKPGTAEELIAVFAQALPYILEDTTTVSWFVGRSEDDPATFVLAHAFVDEAARSAHFESPAAKLIMTEGAPFFASDPAIENFSVIAGSKAKG